MRLLLVTIIFFTQFSQAFIVGGKTTKDYAPVIKFKIGHYAYDPETGFYLNSIVNFDSSCTGTRVEEKHILTSAHCFRSNIERDEYRYLKHKNTDFSTEPERSGPIAFDNRIRSVGLHIHPQYLSIVKKYARIKYQIISKHDLGVITGSEKKEQLFIINQKIIAESEKYDLALIETLLPSKTLYKIFNKEQTTIGERVEMVGYGLPESMFFYKSLEKQISFTLEILNDPFIEVSTNLISHNKSKAKSVATRVPISEESLTKMKKSLSRMAIRLGTLHQKRLKKVGYNEVYENINDIYAIKGRYDSKDERYESSASKGDSGGGLIVQRNGERRVVGVLSNSTEEASDGSVYSRYVDLSLEENKTFINSIVSAP